MSTPTTHGSGAQPPAGGAGAVGQTKEAASQVAGTTKDAASQVAGTAGEEARKVAREASDQARQLFQQTRSDLAGQATSQQDRAAQGLRQLSDQLRSMADSADDGMARGLVDDVARRAGSAAGWLEGRDPAAVLDEARRFAQRRPGAFLAIAAGLGVVAGRMSRSLVDEKRDQSSSSGEGVSTGGTYATGPGTYGSVVGSGSAASSGAVGGGIPSATAPTFTTTESTPLSPGSGVSTAAAGNSTLPGDELPGPHMSTQPLESDGRPAPIGEDGRLMASPDDIARGGR